jgi:hypothetical protein
MTARGLAAAAKERQLRFSIGDLGIALHSVDPDLSLTAEGASSKFVAPDLSALKTDLSLDVRWSDTDTSALGQLAFDSGGGLWRLYRDQGKYTFVFTSPAFGPLPYQSATVDAGFVAGEVRLRRSVFDKGRPIYPLHYPLDELLVVHLLSRGRGIQMHALGLVTAAGDGFLFPGQSGAGKSTMGRLWEPESDVRILSDERIILRKEGNTVWMYGTPWHGEGRLSSPGRAPLRRIFLLRHGARNETVSQTRTEAVTRLFACSFPPFHDADALAFSLRFLEEVTGSCACDELRFVPDRSAPWFVRSGAA